MQSFRRNYYTFQGFQHAVHTAHKMMNDGLLPKVSRELNPKSKRPLMIHRVRAVCDDLLRPFNNPDDDFVPPKLRNRLMTDEELEKEVYGLKIFLSGGSEYACSVCGDMTKSAWFFVPSTKMWHPIGIRGGKNVTAFNMSQAA